MPAIDFPSAPAVNDEYNFEGRTWLWNGTGWEVKSYPAALQLGSASAPSLYFTGDPNTGLYSPGADQVALSTGGTGRLFVDASGRVLVGTATAAIGSPIEILSFGNGNALGLRGRSSDNLSYLSFHPNASATEYARFQSNGDSSLSIYTGSAGTERLRIDSSGRLLVGASASRDTAIGGALLQVEGTTYGGSSIQMVCNSAVDAVTCAHLAFGRSKTTSVGGTGQVVNGDRLGAISWNGAQNSTLSSIAGLIECYVDGEVQTAGDTTDMPGRLVFSTTADGASSPTERMRIDSAGVLQIADAGNIAVGTTTGTKIGTATTQKLGFFNKTPVVQPTAVADATDAASVITQLNALLARMRDLGLIAT